MQTDTIYELKNEFLDMVDIIAGAVTKKLRPAADEITKRQAWDEFDHFCPLYALYRHVKKGPHKEFADYV